MRNVHPDVIEVDVHIAGLLLKEIYKEVLIWSELSG
jgi:hypothetical protein